MIDSEPCVLLDGAHNPAGAEALRDYLADFGRQPLTIVFGAMGDKQLDRIGELLFPLADNLILTAIDNPRAASLETLETSQHDSPADPSQNPKQSLTHFMQPFATRRPKV